MPIATSQPIATAVAAAATAVAATAAAAAAAGNELAATTSSSHRPDTEKESYRASFEEASSSLTRGPSTGFRGRP